MEDEDTGHYREPATQRGPGLAPATVPDAALHSGDFCCLSQY